MKPTHTLTWKPFKGQDDYENDQEQEDALEVSIPIPSSVKQMAMEVSGGTPQELFSGYDHLIYDG